MLLGIDPILFVVQKKQHFEPALKPTLTFCRRCDSAKFCQDKVMLVHYFKGKVKATRQGGDKEVSGGRQDKREK